MKKRIVFIIAFAFLSFTAFSQTKGIIIGNNVRIRKSPSLNSEVVGKLNIKQIVTIYNYSGSGKVINDTWDYWANIGENKWVNALWLYEESFYYPDHESSDGDVIKVSNLSESSNKVHIENLSYEPPFENDISLEIITIDENELLRGTYLISKFHDIYLKGKSEISNVEREEFKIKETEDIIVYENNNIRIYEYQEPEHIGKIEISNLEFTLYFGIKIGMSRNQLIEILGKPNTSKNEYVKYISLEKNGIGEELIFNLENDKISSIVYKIEI